MHPTGLQILATALTAVGVNGHTLWSRQDADYQALVASLSSTAKVFYSGSDDFNNVTTRWSNLDMPTVNVAVRPATENDVVETVKFANKKGLPFLATNSAHGAITTLGKMKSGILLDLDELTGVEIAADGQTVTVAGGTKSHVLSHALWDAGKQAGKCPSFYTHPDPVCTSDDANIWRFEVTGACECVSYLGPGLGGGHGFLQGRHGLIGDQFRSMNVVLANGTLVTINETATPDLWWAMNGAGHNFGIVTSVTSQIYDVEHQDWALELMNFSGDLVKEVYEVTNNEILKNGTQPVDLINWSYWMMSPDLDAEKPIVQVLLMQEGVTTVDPAYTAPFHALGPLSNSSESGVYTDLAKFVGVRTTDGPCLKTGANNPRFPIYLETYNTTAQKLAFDFFANSIVANSALSNSLVTFDDYSMQGVKAKADDSSAYAYRAQNVLVGPLLQYMPGDAALDEEVAKLGNEFRQILHEGTGRDFVPVYLNYAFGNEGPEQWYGQEEWRVTRLQEAKAAYDPNGLFSFYGPIA
ncbi:FAD-linked oxidoreductase [Colletotrichum sp. SAR 10_70]|nr:FAD-linked oxidoreductase [Colletotrichum sp. SAR 10_71]KAI8163344.1 FAD-linked oxidoreductase [Colletotrichum sp. SAR 10_70]KAI8193618.1 FAD-linked oxidoreductase [Colletotrichum sp. SAR 10_65]